MSTAVSPYLQLQRPVQAQILNKLQRSDEFRNTFRETAGAALQYINDPATEVTEDSRRLAEAMNAEADFKINYNPWQREVDDLTPLFSVVNDLLFSVVNGLKKGLVWSSLAMGGLTLWSFKSSKLLVATNGCATIGLLLFSRAVDSYVLASRRHVEVIKALNIGNRNAFSGAIDGHLAQAEKSSKLLRYYFRARKQAIGAKENQGLLLLKEDLGVIRGMRAYIARALPSVQMGIFVSTPSGQEVNLKQIKDFFAKLERILHRGRQVAALGTLMGIGYLYCAYVNRAYLMVVAGLTFSVASGVLCATAHSYQIEVAKMQDAAGEDALLKLFNDHVSRWFIPQAANALSLQEAIVIPLDKILKLIPA